MVRWLLNLLRHLIRGKVESLLLGPWPRPKLATGIGNREIERFPFLHISLWPLDPRLDHLISHILHGPFSALLPCPILALKSKVYSGSWWASCIICFQRWIKRHLEIKQNVCRGHYCGNDAKGQTPSLMASSLRLRLGYMLPTSIFQIALGVLEGLLSVVKACAVWKLWKGKGTNTSS